MYVCMRYDMERQFDGHNILEITPRQNVVLNSLQSADQVVNSLPRIGMVKAFEPWTGLRGVDVEGLNSVPDSEGAQDHLRRLRVLNRASLYQRTGIFLDIINNANLAYLSNSSPKQMPDVVLQLYLGILVRAPE